jgi:hypothetical protein
VKKLLRKAGAIDNKVSLKKIDYSDKSILFMSMTHMSEEKFYEDCRKTIDSLLDKGYFIFGEGASIEGVESEGVLVVKDTLTLKKFRKIIGIEISDYLSHPYFNKYKQRYKIIEQPRYLYAERDSTKKQIIDYSMKQLVAFFEAEKGEVILDECDLKTPLKTEYKCKSLPKEHREYFMKEIVLKKRDELVAETIKKSPKNKILLVYGAAHYEGISKLLKE